jgi:tetratricopeptide (TPR) repeat protein
VQGRSTLPEAAEFGIIRYMSTQPRSNNRAASKRRAATRRRNREMLRRVGAIFFVCLFVLGTATTIFVISPTTNSSAVPAATTVANANNNVPASTVPPAGVTSIVATPNGPQVADIVKQGDDAAAAGKWQDAISYYKAALGLTSGNATIEYDLGKAYVQTKQYDLAVSHLQNALTLNPQASFASDAQTLLNTYKGQVTPGATGAAGAATSSGPSSGVTATLTITK